MLAFMSWYAALAGLVSLAIFSVLYLVQGAVGDQVEASVAATTQAWRHGQALYHALDAPERYSLLYGPVLYLFNRLYFALAPDPILAGKLGGIVCSGLGLLAIYTTARRTSSRWDSMRLAGFGAIGLLAFAEFPLSGRGGPILFMLVAIGTWCAPPRRASQRRQALGWVGVGLAAGLAAGVKLHAPIYFLPTLALALTGPSPVAALAMSAAAFVAALVAPFFACQGVSLVHYAQWLGEAAQHPRSLQKGFGLLLWAGIFLLPGAAAIAFAPERRDWLRRERWPLAGLALCIVCLFAVGSKVGAGRNHAIPLIPIALWLWGEVSASRTGQREHPLQARIVALISIALLAFGIFKMVSMLGRLESAASESARLEIEEILDRESGRRVAVGYGEPQWLSHLRVIPIAQGHPYLLGSVALMDMGLTGMGVTAATVELIEECAVESWLLPRGAAPFVMAGYYQPHRNLFGDGLPIAFTASHSPAYSTQSFTIWRCAAAAGPGVTGP